MSTRLGRSSFGLRIGLSQAVIAPSSSQLDPNLQTTNHLNMLVPSLLTLASVALAAQPAQPAQLYISSIPASVGPTSLTAPQANAVLAHHLGVAQYESLPGPSHRGQGNWQDALGEDSFGSKQKVVVMLECPSAGCAGRSPS